MRHCVITQVRIDDDNTLLHFLTILLIIMEITVLNICQTNYLDLLLHVIRLWDSSDTKIFLLIFTDETDKIKSKI